MGQSRSERVALDGGHMELRTVARENRDVLGPVAFEMRAGPALTTLFLPRSALDELISAAILVRAAIDDEPEPEA